MSALKAAMKVPAYHGTQLRDALNEHDWDDDRMRDRLLLPYFLLCWCFALLVTVASGFWLWLRRPELSGLAWYGWGRHDSPEPVLCRLCLWGGMQRWCYHGYCSCGDWDVEPCDSCPRCGCEL